jgi:hypothetical protein
VRASLGRIFYNVNVTPAELWRDVEKQFRQARLDKQWTPLDVQRAGGPTYKTVQAIEAGRAGNVKNLEKCADALEISFIAVLDAVLAARVTPISPEASYIVRKFVETTVAGRTALLAMANALPVETPPAAASTPTGAATPPAPGRSRPGLKAAARRSGQ